MRKEPKVPPEILAHKVRLGHKGQPARQVLQDHKVLKVTRGLKGQRDHKELQDLKGLKETLDLRVLQALRVQLAQSELKER